MPIRRALVVVLAAALLLSAPAQAAPPPPIPPPEPPATALWSWPLAGRPVVSRPFEAPPNPYAAGHRGVDLPGIPGDPVLAAGAGVVAFAGMVAGRPVVSVEHAGGLRTTYEPVRPTVAAGQAVARGSPLGVLDGGHAGCPAEACLHWGLRRGETYLDPLALLRPPRVRLLPWGRPAQPARSGTAGTAASERWAPARSPSSPWNSATVTARRRRRCGSAR